MRSLNGFFGLDHASSLENLLAENPQRLMFNGTMDALTKTYTVEVNTGDNVRIYFGVGDPNLTSSFHIIGEIFDKVHDQASLTSPPLADVQTTLVPAGGATIVEFKVDYPGAVFWLITRCRVWRKD